MRVQKCYFHDVPFLREQVNSPSAQAGDEPAAQAAEPRAGERAPEENEPAAQAAEPRAGERAPEENDLAAQAARERVPIRLRGLQKLIKVSTDVFFWMRRHNPLAQVAEERAEEPPPAEPQPERGEVAFRQDLQRLMMISTHIYPLAPRNTPLSGEDSTALAQIWDRAHRAGYQGVQNEPAADPTQKFALLINSNLIDVGYQDLKDSVSLTTWGKLFMDVSTLIWGNEKKTNPLFQKLELLVQKDDFNNWWGKLRPQVEPHIKTVSIQSINSSFHEKAVNTKSLATLHNLIFHVVQDKQIKVLRELYLQKRLDECNKGEGEERQPLSWKEEIEAQKNRVKHGVTYCIVHTIVAYFLKDRGESSPFRWDRLQQANEEGALLLFQREIDAWIEANSQGIYKHWILHKSVKLWIWLTHRIVDGILQKNLNKLYELILDQEKWNQQVIVGVEKCARWMGRNPVSGPEKQGIWKAILCQGIEEIIEPLFFHREVGQAEQSMQEWVDRSHFVVLRWVKWWIALVTSCGLHLVEKMARLFLYLLAYVLKEKVAPRLNLPDKVGKFTDNWVSKAAVDLSIQCTLFDSYTEIINYRLKLMEQGVPIFLTPMPPSFLQSCSGPLQECISSVLSSIGLPYMNKCVDVNFLLVEWLYNQGACLEEIFLPLFKSTGDFLMRLKVRETDRRSEADRAKDSFQKVLSQVISSATEKKIRERLAPKLTIKESSVELISWLSSFTQEHSASSYYPFHINLNAFMAKVHEASDNGEQLDKVKEEMRSKLFSVLQLVQNHFTRIDGFCAESRMSKAQIRVITPLLDCLNDLSEKCCKRNEGNVAEIENAVNNFTEIVQDMRWIEWRREVEEEVDPEKTRCHRFKNFSLRVLERAFFSRSQECLQPRAGVSWTKEQVDRIVFSAVCGSIKRGLEFLSGPECVTTLLSGIEIPLSLPNPPEGDKTSEVFIQAKMCHSPTSGIEIPLSLPNPPEGDKTSGVFIQAKMCRNPTIRNRAQPTRRRRNIKKT